jgi:hypothetical protein
MRRPFRLLACGRPSALHPREILLRQLPQRMSRHILRACPPSAVASSRRRWPLCRDRLQQDYGNPPRACSRGQSLVESDHRRADCFRESDEVAVGDRLRRRLSRVRHERPSETVLSCLGLGSEFHPRVSLPSVVQVERLAHACRAAAHHLSIREQPQEPEHREAAEEKPRVVDGSVPCRGREVVRMLVPGQRQPDVDVNQERGRRGSPCSGGAGRAGPCPSKGARSRDRRDGVREQAKPVPPGGRAS